MTYFPENLPAFLWTKVEYENQPSALTIADEALAPTRILTKYSFRKLHLDGHFSLHSSFFEENFLTITSSVCACAAAACFKNVNPVLAYSSFTFHESIFRVINLTIENYMKNTHSNSWKSMFFVSIFLNGFALYIFLGFYAIYRTKSSFFTKCFTIQFFVGALIKLYTWKNHQSVQKMYATYFKSIQHTIANNTFSEANAKKFHFTLYDEKARIGEQDSLVLDMRNKVIGYFTSEDFLALRLVSKDWSFAITKVDILICRINEQFSQKFINHMGLANLFSVLCVNPLDQSPITISNLANTHEDIYKELCPFLGNALVDKTLIWGKLADKTIYLCFGKKFKEWITLDILEIPQKGSEEVIYSFGNSPRMVPGTLAVTRDIYTSNEIDETRITRIFERTSAANFKEIY